MADQELQPKQLHALLDILSHHAVYAEIEDFRFPAALDHYGPPFETVPKTPSQTPALQTLVSDFLLHLPGLRDIEDAFWKERVATIIKDFEKAELSESYDKGHIGIRKTLATAISALIEYPVRGVFAGFDEPTEEDRARQYDISKADDIQRAFRDLMHQMVYGHIIDDLVKKVGETDKLSEHTQLVQATHEYVIVNLASFMHYTLIISPKGQNLLTLIDHANKLVPYAVMKQTLRIGNVASMVNAMMKVVLAKMSMGSVTNWIGWTSGADEGMNLVQHVIAQVLQWDNRDLKSRAVKIEKDKQAPKKEQLEAIKAYLSKTRSEHDNFRERSHSTSKSIISVILEHSSASPNLTEDAHKLAQDYLAIQLAIRDRDQIIKVLCRSTPDHLTQSIRDLAAAYDPLIRQTHNAVDLSATLTDFEVFLRDLIKLAKLSDARGRTTQKAQDPPTVGDFVQLLKKHQGSSHRFLHQVVKDGPEITSWFRDYALQAASHFRRSDTSGSNPTSTPGTKGDQRNAGDLTTHLQNLYRSLPSQKQTSYRNLLDNHAKYLSTLHTASSRRLHAVLTSPPSKHPIFSTKSSAATSASQPASRSSSPGPGDPTASTAGLDAHPGPGAFLARWQALIDGSEITPDFWGSGVRTGGRGSVLKASRVGADSGTGGVEEGAADVGGKEGAAGQSKEDDVPKMEEQDSGDEDVFEEAHEKLDQLGLEDGEKMRPPDVSALVGELLPGFREVLGRRGCDW